MTVSLDEAAARLRAGGLVAFPTETVYGLGADAASADAVARIFAAKGRPRFNPLIAHVATVEAAREQGHFDADADTLAVAFWPGPLTLVLPRAAGGTVCDLACAGLATVGLRVPAHPVATALLRIVGRPVAAPSANRSGRLSPTRAVDVADDLGPSLDPARDAILEGGDCPVGVESTIVACLGNGAPVLLRPGGLPREDVERVLGRALGAAGDAVVAPGMLASHYAPAASLRLEAVTVTPGEAGLDFAGRLGGGMLDLSPGGDLAEAAANLYRHLRRLDAAAPPPHRRGTGAGARAGGRDQRSPAPRRRAATMRSRALGRQPSCHSSGMASALDAFRRRPTEMRALARMSACRPLLRASASEANACRSRPPSPRRTASPASGSRRGTAPWRDRRR